jgi:hypothetical protein
MGYRYRSPQQYNAPRLTPETARALLARCGISVGTEYCGLTQEQTAPLLDEADRRGYRPPRGSLNSLTLHFYSYVDRVAQRAK